MTTQIHDSHEASPVRKSIDFYFSFISLWSYIGSEPFQALVERQQLQVNYKPMDLYQVFQATGGKPPHERPPARQAYRLAEMARWQAIRGIPLNVSPKHYPVQPSHGHRMLLAAQADGEDVSRFLHLALRGVWADELNVEDPDTIRRLADQAGLDGAGLYDIAAEQVWVDQEAALTQEALARNVFGAPFYFYRDEPFWGQDRLELLERAIGLG
ncbi:2-hydroxychromene-2-carboxylate isomerase [Pandoraea fibrosis]|uniref:2-hydroxychromene-2-carboxylate isomerase n=1 Tax=Pandoraea fibrosis TaxID=1891094 RepID=A0ABX6HR95_9BURK|nr:2-hydroxychromene-2-carboxylate isomerase [Pandoraea fibrosis]QHE93010.1 2-hydroxychromene-2-carboxylate isomerase [Pandoraea fibrosis]QHF13432.1 2-hydroxychromene-2-carboxylate isomerase [Pandoraea fibrosis]